MFLPPKLTTILFAPLMAVTMLIGSADGQQADFERRLAAMQEARVRAQLPASQSTRIASADMGVEFASPPVPQPAPRRRRVVLGQTNNTGSGTRVARLPAQTTTRTQTRAQTAPLTQARAQTIRANQVRSRANIQQSAPVQKAAPVQRTSRNVVQGYTPTHERTAQLMGDTFIDGGSPIVSSPMVGSSVMGAPIMDSTIVGSPVVGSSMGCTSCGTSGIVGTEIIDGSCSSCGDVGGYFDDQCCDRGGCPQGGCGRGGCLTGNCWLSGLGAILYNGEYFGGATSFRSALFNAPGGAPGTLANDSSHGFYGGYNVGVPLCNLTCGVFSGQLGIRSVQTNFNGAEFTPNNRNQLFVTAGFFRRVDYGLQAGVVADILHEEWFTTTDLIQIRTDIGWVYPSGTSLGFRYATNVQDDVNSGQFAGNPFNGLLQSTDDNYRIYYRKENSGRGYGEAFIGWSDSDQTIIGLDFDSAIASRLSVQAGFTYYLNDDPLPAGTTNVLGGNGGEAYNIFVGFAFRPRGTYTYSRSYDRPLFSVADNGTMLITRQ